MRRFLLLAALLLAACGSKPTQLSQRSSESPTANPTSQFTGTETSEPLPTVTPTPGTLTSSPKPSSHPATTSPKPSTTSSPGGDCTGSELSVSVHTDHASYARGDAVGITISAKNVSGHTCNAKGNACQDHVYVANASGQTIWSSTPVGRGSCIAPQNHVLSPGQSQTYSFSWDQKTTNGSQAPPGSYKARGVWSVYGNGSDPNVTPANFSIG